MVGDRRGEAHLWLVVEEALMAVRRDPDALSEAARNFRSVAEALTTAGACSAGVAEALVGELDDALAVRSLLPASAFSARPWPDEGGLETAPSASAAEVWIEAEIERHLDLLVSFSPQAQSWAALDLLRILAGPVRAFEAVGAGGGESARLLESAAASLAAVGIDPGRAVGADAVARPEWVGFLRDRPAPLPEPHEVLDSRQPRQPLGQVAGRAVRVEAVAWSEDAIDLTVAVRGPGGGIDRDLGAAWQARLLDDRGHLHLGQPAVLRGGAGLLSFALRPGLGPGVTRVDLRLSRRGQRVEASIDL